MRITALIFAVVMMFMLPFSAGSGESAAADVPVVVLRVADYGEIYLELYPEYAPLTVENFLRLVDSGFYNGLTFHRIISGFMAQGGCPLGNGTGSSGTNIRGEFSSNGVDNPLKHERGVVSMARSGDPDSASCQFFIKHADAPHLDGSYAAFGRVLSGMGIVDAICRNAHVIDSNGSVPGEDQPVITEAARADRAEAEAASAREAENGSEGGVFDDPVSGLSFPMPDGWRRHPPAFFPSFPSPSIRPMDVVDFPSPRGVGVIAVTSTYFPFGLSRRRSMILPLWSFGVLPKGMISSGRRPSFS